MPLLSAAIIARDEEQTLPDCLASLRGIADDIVVLDTGSVDQTRAVAREAGARVESFDWVGSFAAARNAAIDCCVGEWILYIDCDERIRGGTAGDLHARLRDPHALGYRVRFHVRPSLTPYWEMRLFRNHPALRFDGAIHENIWPAVLRLAATQGGEVGRLDLTLDHFGYEGDLDHKHTRNLPLLLRAVAEDPTHVYCWSELGRIYWDRAQVPLARHAFQQGIAAVRAKSAIVGQDSLPFTWLARIGMETGDPAPGPVIAEALALFPSHPQLIWLQGQLALRERHFAAAATCFQTLRQTDPDSIIDPVLAYDRRLFGAWPSAGLAACHLAEGRFREAASLFADAVRLAPDDLEYRVKQEMAQRLADQVT